jgi:uncharacterized protein (DUF58 family)
MKGRARHAAAGDDGWLEGLTLAVRRGMGERPGERRFPGRPGPAGVEVEGHAAYAPGDDLRHLDWNVLGRLDALLVRRFTAERELELHLLLDASASMGAPPDKGARARELVCALARMALAAGDAVRVVVLGGEAPLPETRPLRSRAALPRVTARLSAARPAGGLDLGEALAAHACRHARPGAAVVVSDFMAEPAALARGVHALRARRFDVVLLQVLAREELEPSFGDAVLVDAESGARHPVALSAALRARYRALLDAHCTAVARVATGAGAFHATLVSDVPLAAFIVGELARRGLVRRR